MLRERDLVEAARQGDEHAFRRLVEPHRDRLRSRCYRVLRSHHDADDALQEALVRAWRGLPGLDSRRAVGPWLYRIATNSSLDELARRRRTVPVDTAADPDHEPAAAAASPAARYEQREAVEHAISTVDKLPDRQRDALILDALGYSAGESAAALHTTRASVYSAVQRARKVIGEASEPALGAR